MRRATGTGPLAVSDGTGADCAGVIPRQAKVDSPKDSPLRFRRSQSHDVVWPPPMRRHASVNSNDGDSPASDCSSQRDDSPSEAEGWHPDSRASSAAPSSSSDVSLTRKRGQDSASRRLPGNEAEAHPAQPAHDVETSSLSDDAAFWAIFGAKKTLGRGTFAKV